MEAFCCSDLSALVQKSGSGLRSLSRLSGFRPISLRLRLTVKICRVKLLSTCCTLATRVRMRKVAVSRTGPPTHFIGSRCGPGETILVRVSSHDTLALRPQMRKVAKSGMEVPCTPLALRTLRYHIGLFWVT
jgi:hypothetical protein